MLRLAIVGATGVVGRECLTLIELGAGPAIEGVTAVASAASVGADLGREMGLHVPVTLTTTPDEVDFGGVDVAIFCAGAAVTREHAPRAAEAGALVVDNSSAYRMLPEVPLVIPQVNPHTMASRPAAGIVANPNCSTIQLVRVLHPLQALAGLERVIVSTYQAASGGGVAGLTELAAASGAALAGREPVSDGTLPPGLDLDTRGAFGPPLAFNLVPQIGDLDEDGLSHEERKLAREPRKILELPDLVVTATAVRVPVFNCHSEAVHVQLRRPVTVGQVEDALAAAPGLRVYRRNDDPAFPMPRVVGAAGAGERELVHVGRVRVDPDDARGVWLWIVADNLWVGAALNALQVAELGVAHGWLARATAGQSPRP